MSEAGLQLLADVLSGRELLSVKIVSTDIFTEVLFAQFYSVVGPSFLSAHIHTQYTSKKNIQHGRRDLQNAALEHLTFAVSLKELSKILVDLLHRRRLLQLAGVNGVLYIGTSQDLLHVDSQRRAVCKKKEEDETRTKRKRKRKTHQLEPQASITTGLHT